MATDRARGATGRPVAGAIAVVSAGAWDACGVRTDGTVTCWGFLSDS